MMNDPTTWFKECGVVAQGIYYDAHTSFDIWFIEELNIEEEGTAIPLPEIPSSIDPQQDPDNSTWGD